MTCLTEKTVFELVQGRLSPPRLVFAEEHLVQCSACRTVVADSAKFFAEGSVGQRSHGDQAAPDTPAQVGRYSLGLRVGAGAMGVVYAGHDPQLHRTVALKLLRADGAHDPLAPEQQRRLLREARAMAQLAHPNVVTVHDAGTFEGGVFIAMELVEGETLRQWLRRDPRPEISEVLRVFTEAGRGLGAAHVRGMVHRDFKPDNVLIGTDGRARVTDFGLVRPATSEEPGPTGLPPPSVPTPGNEAMTVSATVFAGTPAYMAPEQFSGQPAEPRTDQFSFCVALHEALFGTRPFVGRTQHALARAVVAAQLPEPPRGTGVPAAVFEVLRRGLSRRPEDRFATMDDLLSTLTRSTSPASAAPPSRWRFNAALASVGTVLLAGALVTWAAGARARPPATPSPPTPTLALPLEGQTSTPPPTAPAPDALITRAPLLPSGPVPVGPTRLGARPPTRRAAPGKRAAAEAADPAPSSVQVAPLPTQIEPARYGDGLRNPFEVGDAPASRP